MVFFSCDGCGEMLKKAQVDGHARRCRRCESVSCVDCCVSFYGDDYRAHTSCMTEAERYEGKLAKSANSKKRNPQQEWMDVVATCVASAPPNLQHYLQSMSHLDNIPRKEKQFRNFTSNSLNLRGRNEAVVGEIWKLLKAERDRRQAIKAQEQKEQQRQKEEKEAAEQAQKNEKQSRESPDKTADTSERETDYQEADDDDTQPQVDQEKFRKALKKTLKNAPNRSMKIKELRKVLGEKLGLPKSAKKVLKRLLIDAPKFPSKKTRLITDGKRITLE